MVEAPIRSIPAGCTPTMAELHMVLRPLLACIPLPERAVVPTLAKEWVLVRMLAVQWAQERTPSAGRVVVFTVPAATTTRHSGVAPRRVEAMSTSPGAAAQFGCVPTAG